MEQTVRNAPMSRRAMMAGALAGLSAPFIIRPVFASTSSAEFDALLKIYVVDRGDGLNLVNYSAFKASGHGQLKNYLTGLQAISVSGLSKVDQMTFWINLYNAKTLDVVLDYYPVASIKQIDLGGGVFGRGPWKAKLVNVEGMSLSLDAIEHDILRRRFSDPLIHYALNCASIGCPNLQQRTWRASTLSAQFDEGARLYVNHPRGLSLASGDLTASKIYRWYSGDFGGRSGLKAHWLAYANPALAAGLSKDASPGKYVYDWSLNDVR